MGPDRSHARRRLAADKREHRARVEERAEFTDVEPRRFAREYQAPGRVAPIGDRARHSVFGLFPVARSDSARSLSRRANRAAKEIAGLTNFPCITSLAFL